MADDTEAPGSESPAGKDAAHYPTDAHEVETPNKNHWKSMTDAYNDGVAHGYYRAMTRKTQNAEEAHTMDGIASDKVNIHVGGGEGRGDGGAGLAAVIAALGNRNQGGDNAALLAALGNRNQNDMAPILAMLANRDDRRGDDGFGFGGGGILGLLAILGLLRGRGGLGGGDEGCDNRDGDFARTAILQSLVEGQADLRAQVPTAALEIQNAICRSIAELALGTQQGLSNVKDSVQAIGALNLSATQGVAKDVATGTLQTIIGINTDGDRTRALLVAQNEANLNRQLTVAQLESQECRIRGHVDNVENRVIQSTTVNTNQQQQQWQYQRFDDERFSRLAGLVANIGNVVQRSRSDQDIVNLGTMLASGTQTPTNTQVGRQ